ncbi:MAG: hypothetical protein WBV39_16385 [Rudaea sp.]
MELATLASIANVIGSIAVVISLVYLSLQIRQSARNQRSIMDRGRSQQVGDWLQSIARADTAELVLRGHAGDPTLDATELHRYLWCMYPLFLHFEDSYFQHRDGMIGEGQYASILGHLKSQCSTPGFRALWSHIRKRFPADFVGFIDAIMRDAVVDRAEITGWTAAWQAQGAHRTDAPSATTHR